ncbi:MAG: O-antigen ligase family protein [Methylococcaceae bacterium]|nr:O-antigen ligase family protein [Methylococcaceae bacterium]
MESDKSLIINFLSWSLGLMPLLVLTLHIGIHIASIALLILSLFILFRKEGKIQRLRLIDKFFVVALCVLPIVIAFDCLLRGASFRYLDYPLRFIFALPIFFALRRVTVNMLPFIYGIAIGAIGAGCIALYQHLYLGIDRVYGTVHIIPFGHIALQLGLLSFAALIMYRDFTIKLILMCLIAGGLGIIGAILSGTRGTWLVIIPILIIWFIYIQIKIKAKILIILSVFFSLIFLYNANHYIHQRIAQGVEESADYFQEQENNTSVGLRLEMWKGSVLIFQDKPLLGVGMSHYRSAMEEKNRQGFIHLPKIFDQAHNAYLHYLATLGIIGLFSYLLLLGGAGYYFIFSLKVAVSSEMRFAGIAGLVLVTSYMTYDLTGFSFGHQHSLMFLVIMMVSFAGITSSSYTGK